MRETQTQQSNGDETDAIINYSGSNWTYQGLLERLANARFYSMFHIDWVFSKLFSNNKDTMNKK